MTRLRLRALFLGLLAALVIATPVDTYSMPGVAFRREMWDFRWAYSQLFRGLITTGDFDPYNALVSFRWNVAYTVGQVEDTAWQAQFAGAPTWAAWGVVDDGNTGSPTDNAPPSTTVGLNALPPYTPVIGPCPTGGVVQFQAAYNNQWLWKSHLRIWQKKGCYLRSAIPVLPGPTQPIAASYPPITQAGGFAATAPLTDIQYYGLQVTFVNQQQGVHVASLWANGLTMKYGDIVHTGGFIFLRGSDQEIAYFTMEDTVAGAGNPGIRHFGNVPKVPTTTGKHENDWFHHNHILSGDGAFQVCQPSTNAATWGYNVSTDGILYEYNYGESATALILVNEYVPAAGSTYYCRNARFRHIVGANAAAGTGWLAIIGDSNQETSGILLDDVKYNDATAVAGNKPAVGIGAFNYGGVIATAPNTFDITLNKVEIDNPYEIAVGVNGAHAVAMSFLTVTTPQVGSASVMSTVMIDGASQVTVSNGNIAAGKNAGAISDGANAATSGDYYSMNTLTGVNNGKSGYVLGNSSGAIITGGSVTPAVGATTAQGITAQADPSGTHNATVSLLDLTQMPVPEACATGQGNSFSNNPGAANCF